VVNFNRHRVVSLDRHEVVSLNRQAVVNMTGTSNYSPFSLEPPNIVTPNDDHENDTFHIPDLPKDNCENRFIKIEIYNRWGDRVFESESRDFSWNPANCTDGVYFYSLEYTNNKIKGWILVVR